MHMHWQGPIRARREWMGRASRESKRQGLEEWLDGIRNDLRAKTYTPQAVRRVKRECWGLFRGGLNAHRSDRSPSFTIFFAQILVEILELLLFFERSFKSAQRHLCFEVVPCAGEHGLRVPDYYCQYQSCKS
jgi:hypothetical protein